MNALQTPPSIVGDPCCAALLAPAEMQSIRPAGLPAGAKQGEEI